MRNIYRSLAANALGKNKIIYVPYIISSIMMITITFIIFNISRDEVIGSISGGSSLQMLMFFGLFVMYMISFFFLNSVSRFVIKQRKKELGLYSMLGMQKKHIIRVHFIETFFVYILSVIPASVIGVVVSKFLQLVILKIYHNEADFGWKINWIPILINMVAFGFFFLIYFLFNCVSILRSNSLDYMKEEAKGEKKPKSNWPLALAGVFLLSCGYLLAIRSQSAVQAFSFFFFAVSLVIFGTICLFTAGSITILNTMKKKKNYYYKTSHFISVSGMLYRMKRNAATLATICIFATMVLVTISSVMTLYSSIRTQTDRWYRVDFDIVYEDGYNDKAIAEHIRKMEEKAAQIGMQIDKVVKYKDYNAYANIQDGVVLTYPNYRSDTMTEVFVLSLDLYNLANDVDIELEKGQLGYYPLQGAELSNEIAFQTIDLSGAIVTEKSPAFELVRLPQAPQIGYGMSIDMSDGIYFFVTPDEESLEELTKYINSSDVERGNGLARVLINTSSDESIQRAFYDDLVKNYPEYGFNVSCRIINIEDVIGLYGGLFFLGIFLSIAFLTITILNMYFSQLLQGYEDSRRFAIMRKVGLTRKEIRKSINSQIVVVFLLPLLVAVIHTMAAYPMVNRILRLIGGCEPQRFLLILGACITVFAIVYTIAYLFTRRTYLRLVSKN